MMCPLQPPMCRFFMNVSMLFLCGFFVSGSSQNLGPTEVGEASLNGSDADSRYPSYDTPFMCLLNGGPFDYVCTISELSDLSRVPTNARSLKIYMSHQRQQPLVSALTSSDSDVGISTSDRLESTAGATETGNNGWKLPMANANLTVLSIPKSVFPTMKIRNRDGTYRLRAAVPRRAFADLTQLTKLTIYGDIGDDGGLVLADGSFDGLSSVEHLTITRLGLGELTPGSLRGLHKLGYLHLQNNHLTEFPASVSAPLRELRFIGLSGNHVADVRRIHLPVIRGSCEDEDSSSSCRRPTLVVDLGNNRIERLVASSFIVSGDLGDVTPPPSSSPSDSSSDEEAISDQRQHSSSLTATKKSTSSGWRSVTDLDLSGNRIIRIGSATFAGLVALQRLHLERNEIVDMEAGAFADLPKLRKLDLSHNRLASIGVNISGTIGSRRRRGLVNFILANNPWNCDCKLRCRLRRLMSTDGFVVADSSSSSAVCRSPAELIDRRVTSLIELDDIANVENVMNSTHSACRPLDCDDDDDDGEWHRDRSTGKVSLIYVIVAFICAIVLFGIVLVIALLHVRFRTGTYSLVDITGRDVVDAPVSDSNCVLCSIACCSLSIECSVVSGVKKSGHQKGVCSTGKKQELGDLMPKVVQPVAGRKIFHSESGLDLHVSHQSLNFYPHIAAEELENQVCG